MKKIVVLILGILSCVSIWYLFIKEYDYQITFKSKGSPGSVYHQIVSWESWGADPSARNISTIDTTLFQKVTQRITLKDTIINLDWTLESVNDSITEIKVGIKSNDHSIINRLGALTGETEFTRSLKKELKGFGKGANKFAKNFKIQIEGISEIPPLEYLYASSKSNRIEKAIMMLRLNSDLYPKILDNEVEKNGYPFVKITEWDTSTDAIKFNFGFPIKYKDSLPISSVIKHDKSPAQKALKATFYGNYRDSDQAWFALIEYAKRRGISIEKKPLEIFYNDPMLDGNASQWKAEVFLPIID
ncbi:hypothetical protein [uncultured Aquimarina sp.]|uniref:GyrI-like domain-containing protein n=1 Tax=uncultured Aquimarina sp. TaxID=575652 RepID=UPI00262120E5|nr:hypothetical protein [uncultured Aquimarina sp.]